MLLSLIATTKVSVGEDHARKSLASRVSSSVSIDQFYKNIGPIRMNPVTEIPLMCSF